MKKVIRKDIIRTKLKEMQESIKLAEENLPDAFEEFSKLGLIKDGIYKRVEFAIENIFDVCAIMNADLELGIPESDEGIVDNLVRENILTDVMRNKLKSMKGFRNIVVHAYGKVDDRLAFSILKKHIRDFYEFMDRINDFLNK